MIFAVESARAFDSVKVFGVLDHANNSAVALIGGANVADIFFGVNRVKANFAGVSIELDRANRRRQIFHVIGFHFDDMISEPSGSFNTDARQFGKRLNQSRHCF